MKYFDSDNHPSRATAQVTIYGSVLTLTGSSGTATITIGNGSKGYAKVITWDASSLSTTMTAFVTANFEYYKALGYTISNAAQVLTVVPRYGWDSINGVKVTIANLTTNLSGTLTGVFQADFSKAKTWQVTFGQNIAVRAPIGCQEGDKVRVEFKATGAYTTTFDVLSWFFAGGLENVQTSTSLDVIEGQFNKSMFPRIDKVTLTGSSGTATVLAGGLSKTATYNGNLNTTSSDFVTANAAAYLEKGLVLTDGTGILVFTAVAGNKTAEFYAKPAISNATLTLAGTVVQYPAGRVLVKALDQDIKQ
jgi:hypothetical protein